MSSPESPEVVTIAQLASVFTTPAWAGLKDANSTLCKVLAHPLFRNDNHVENQVSTDYLKIYALLHCPGTVANKVRYLYDLLQEGGTARHQFITSVDKDFIPVMTKFITFATKDIFTIAEEVGNVKNQYTADDCDTIDSRAEEVHEDYLDHVFGAKSKLNNEDFFTRAEKVGAYIFIA